MSAKKPLQRRIILHLAQSKPQTINEIAIAISRDWKTSSIAFKKLEEECLVAKTGKPKYHRGRKFPYFWLTDLGVLRALHEGAKPETLLRATLEIYPENKNLQLLIEAIPILGKHASDVLYLVVKTRGAIEQTDLTSIFAAQTLDKLTPKQIREFVAVLKKYPTQHQQTRKSLKELSDLL
jgi:hypothetical protein